MHRSPFIDDLLILAFFTCAYFADAQTSTPSYKLNISVDEVVLFFHAADVHGLSVNDLKLNELNLLDNGKPPDKIIDFQSRQNFPIRAGILIDTSASMEQHLPRNRAIATVYAQHLLRQQIDQAFIMDFGYISRITQPWTSDPVTLIAAMHNITAGKANPLGGTALFDTLYRACLYEFGKIDHAASANFILLFSDGEDNASHTSLEDVVNVCRRTNTAIYTFRAETKSSLFSSGPRTLEELASESGGRVFHNDDSEAAIYSDLRTIEADLRNQYRLIYKPADLKHDGTFHRIDLKAPERVDNITVRSGYYAPVH